VLAKTNATGNPEFEKLANLLKAKYLDKGNLGRATGRGFYTYPDPSFASPNFLRNQ
jgi:3-hydroxybutyryl-CoA dehydrogenase